VSPNETLEILSRLSGPHVKGEGTSDLVTSQEISDSGFGDWLHPIIINTESNRGDPGFFYAFIQQSFNQWWRGYEQVKRAVLQDIAKP
jgi:hypothetical protein